MLCVSRYIICLSCAFILAPKTSCLAYKHILQWAGVDSNILVLQDCYQNYRVPRIYLHSRENWETTVTPTVSTYFKYFKFEYNGLAGTKPFEFKDKVLKSSFLDQTFKCDYTVQNFNDAYFITDSSLLNTVLNRTLFKDIFAREISLFTSWEASPSFEDCFFTDLRLFCNSTLDLKLSDVLCNNLLVSDAIVNSIQIDESSS